MSNRNHALVVDSAAAKEIIKLLCGFIYEPDQPLDINHVLDAVELSNQLIHLYLTDPPALEELLEDRLHYLDPEVLAQIVEGIEDMLDGTLQTTKLDLLDVKETIIGDWTGMVMLMI